MAFATVSRYNIRIESTVTEQLQLRERYWRICSLSGTLETVRGKGVIGQVGKRSRILAVIH
jgi:uncharacterized protein affecting Mg2+/Co2+ transport